MRIGLCASLDQAKSADLSPIDYIEGMTFDALVPDKPDAEFRAKLAIAESLPRPLEALNCFIPGSIKTTGPEVSAAIVDAYVRVVFERARQCGVKIIVFGSGNSRMVPDGFPYEKAFGQLAGHLKRWGDWAAAANLTVVIEPLSTKECNIMNSVPEAQRLAQTVDHPSICILADFYHMGCDGEDPANLAHTDRLLRHVHIAEVAKRMFPGYGQEDFAPYLRELKRGGYAGAISLECGFENLAADLPRATAYLRNQLRDAGL
jgi:sugar phosphate isomerase/epimerase